MRKWVEFRNGLRVAGHPAHSLFVHYPMAFLAVVFPLELLGWLGWPSSGLGWTLAFWSQAFGLAASLPAAVTGLINLTTLTDLSDHPKASATANLHMYVMLGAVSLAGLGIFLKDGAAPVQGGMAFVNLGLSLSTLVLLVLGGWLGGELVYRHGVAQEKD